jgi:hypothetical protein
MKKKLFSLIINEIESIMHWLFSTTTHKNHKNHQPTHDNKKKGAEKNVFYRRQKNDNTPIKIKFQHQAQLCHILKGF